MGTPRGVWSWCACTTFPKVEVAGKGKKRARGVGWGARVGGSQSTRRKLDGWLTEVKMVKEWSGTRMKKDMKSSD